MRPERLTECLRLVRWPKDVLAEALDVPSEFVTGWLAGTGQIPGNVGTLARGAMLRARSCREDNSFHSPDIKLLPWRAIVASGRKPINPSRTIVSIDGDELATWPVAISLPSVPGYHELPGIF
jgi:hypothetical protein